MANQGWLSRKLFSSNRPAVDETDDGLPPVPKDTLGLRVLHPAEEPDVDIVAVHGLGGDAYSTWMASNEHCWLKDSLPQALEHPPADFSFGANDSKSARVMTFGYDASLFTKASSQRSFTFAENLLSELKDRRVGPAAKRPLILLGHSLGGIVIKKALVIAQSRPRQWGDILSSVVHLCFFGTPHQGANSVAGFLLNLGSALTRSKEGSVLQELKLWSPSLIEANQMWVEIANGFTITSFFEREKYNGVLVVPEGSARLNRDNETVVPMDRNHIDICKFGGADDPMFLKVFGRLHAEIAEIGTQAQAEDQAERVQRLLQAYTSRSQSEDRLKVLQWLSPPDARPPVLGSREPGTNEWFLQGDLFRCWLSGQSKYLILDGPVGCGKSVLLRTISTACLEAISNGNPTTSLPDTIRGRVVTFYFSSTNNLGLGLNDLLRYLLARLYSKAIPKALQQLYERSTESFPPQPPDDDEALINVLFSSLAQPHDLQTDDIVPVYLLIDALDEISSLSKCRQVTGFLNRLRTIGLRNVHILTTTRPLGISDSWRSGWEQHTIPPSCVVADIGIYVRRTVAEELSDLPAESKNKIIARLTGSTQTMFRYAYLQLQSLLESGLLLDSDVDETLANLPNTLNETYDTILRRIRPAHAMLARTALCWLAAAHRPLRLEELTDACLVHLERGGQVEESERLKPSEIAALLRHLVTFDREPKASDVTSNLISGSDYVVFAHFSVREYLTVHTYMAADLRSRYFFDLDMANAEVASSCIAYLLATNTIARRKCLFPLRSYAWDYWALHLVLNALQDPISIEDDAEKLFERVAFGKDHSVDKRLREATRWAHSQEAVLRCLRRPYFFHEYAGKLEEDGDYNDDPESLLYRPLAHHENQIRLLRLLPNRSRFSGIRCKMITASLNDDLDFEALSYTWGVPGKRDRYIWVNGIPTRIMPTAQDVLRNLRLTSLSGKTVWLDTLCINQRNPAERINQVSLMHRIYSSSSALAIWVNEASTNETWALELLILLSRTLGAHHGAGSYREELKDALRSKPSLDPFEWLLALFQRDWFRRAWVLQEVALGRNPVILYGAQPLSLEQLSRFVSNAAQACQLIMDASEGRNIDSSLLTASVDWRRVESLVQILNGRMYGTLTPVQLLYRSKDHQCVYPPDRFWSLCALMPLDTPHPDYRLSLRDTCLVFCTYVITRAQNLDILTLVRLPNTRLSSGEESRPSWTGYCWLSPDVVYPEPLLIEELEGAANGPFCAGGRTSDSINITDDAELQCVGYIIDGIQGWHEDPSKAQERLRVQGCEHFGKHRQWYRSTSGLAILAGEEAKFGQILVVLKGGKTPYILEVVPHGKYMFMCEW